MKLIIIIIKITLLLTITIQFLKEIAHKNLNKRNKFVFQQKEPFWKKIFIIIKLGEFNLIEEKNILKIIILLKLKVFLNN